MIIKQDAIPENDLRFQQIILHFFVLLCNVKFAKITLLSASEQTHERRYINL